MQSAKRDLDRLRSAIDDLSGLRRGRVVLATVEATQDLAQVRLGFRAKFPGVDLEVRILGTHQVAETLLKEEADIGIALDRPLRNELLLRMRWPQPLQAVMKPRNRPRQSERKACATVKPSPGHRALTSTVPNPRN